MAFLVKEDVLFDPSDVSFFSSDAIVADSDRVADFVEKFRHCRPRYGSRLSRRAASESLSGIHLGGANRDYAS